MLGKIFKCLVMKSGKTKSWNACQAVLDRQAGTWGVTERVVDAAHPSASYYEEEMLQFMYDVTNNILGKYSLAQNLRR